MHRGGDDRRAGQHCVLPVDLDGELDVEEVRRRFERGDPPDSAAEYLMRVRWEAGAIPAVMVSDVDARQYDDRRTELRNTPGVAQCHPDLLPNLAWEAFVLREFAAQRAGLTAALLSTVKATPPTVPPLPPRPLPRLSDTVAWKEYCFGGRRAGADAGVAPLLSVLVRMDEVMTIQLLKRHIGRFCSSAQPPSAVHTEWMYGLLARLELPLEPDTASSLRQLIKHLAKLRAKLHPDATTSPPPHVLAHVSLAHLNLILVLVLRFFGQGGAPPPPMDTEDTDHQCRIVDGEL